MTYKICGERIVKRGPWDKDSSAWPVEKGRCCDTCNSSVVIPARLVMAELVYERKRQVGCSQPDQAS